MSHTHHALDYVELNVGPNVGPNVGGLAAARAFYEAAFGWGFNDYGPTYAGIRAPGGDGEVGGLNAERAPTPGGPLVLLYSDDLDATVAAVEAAGGRVTDGPYGFPGGRRFHFADPSGNVLGVWATS